MLHCDYCEHPDSIREFDGENVCTNCGTVSKFPIIVTDWQYEQHSDALFDTDDKTSNRLKNNDDKFEYVQSNFSLSDNTIDRMKSMYNKYIDTENFRGSTNKHLVLICVCLYVCVDGLTHDDICLRCNLNSTDFHKIYKRMCINRKDCVIDSSISSIMNNLCVRDFNFKKQFRIIYDRITRTESGVSILSQFKVSKLYSVIGYIVFRKFKYDVNVGDSALLNLLNISRPTLTKISKVIDKL